jgi:hypothetical protein
MAQLAKGEMVKFMNTENEYNADEVGSLKLEPGAPSTGLSR